MSPSPQELPPDAAQRAADVFEFLAKLAGSAAIVWGFIAKVLKPYNDWRRRRLVEAIRSALKEELEVISRLEARDEKLDLVLERQSQIFEEMDLFMLVTGDAAERLDELQGLLDEVGFASPDRRIEVGDRRAAEYDRRRAASLALEQLSQRLTARRRGEPIDRHRGVAS